MTLLVCFHNCGQTEAILMNKVIYTLTKFNTALGKMLTTLVCDFFLLISLLEFCLPHPQPQRVS